jgi:hypothetical protein
MKAAYADHMRNTALKISVVGLLAAGIAVAYLSLTRDVSQPPKPGMTLVAEVNGKPITAEVFNEKYSRFTLRFHVPVAESPTSVSELKLGFLNKLIETELLLQEAEVRDEWKEDRKEKLLIDKLIKREVDSVIHVSDDEIREYYDANKDEFQQPLMVRARQIVVGTEEEADALRTRLVRGEDFAEIARLHSLSPDAQSGGDLGVFAKGQMPEVFDEIVFRYRVGSISKVVKSPYGYHIFKVEDRIRPRLQKIEEVRDQIAAAIFQGRQEAFFKDWLDSLKKQARIIIYPENLEDIS